MSHEAVSWALRQAPVPLTEKGKPDTTARFVLVDLAEHANTPKDDQAVTWVSSATISFETGFDERTVRKSLARLEKDCVITRDGKRRTGATKWRLNLKKCRPASDRAEFDAEVDEARRRDTERRRAARDKAAVEGAERRSKEDASASLSGTQDTGQTEDDRGSEDHAIAVRSVTDANADVSLSGTQNPGQATGCPVRKAPESGTQNPGVRYAAPPEPSGTTEGTVIGGHAAPRTPLRTPTPSGPGTDQGDPRFVGGADQTLLATQPPTRAREEPTPEEIASKVETFKACPHGLPAEHRPDGTPRCALCRRGLPDKPEGVPDAS